MEVLVIYLVMMLDNIKLFLDMVANMAIATMFLCVLFWLASSGQYSKGVIKYLNYATITCLVLCFANAFTPTTKQGMVLVASGAVIEAAKTETAQ